jgi:hypothetical protein
MSGMDACSGLVIACDKKMVSHTITGNIGRVVPDQQVSFDSEKEAKSMREF